MSVAQGNLQLNHKHALSPPEDYAAHLLGVDENGEVIPLSQERFFFDMMLRKTAFEVAFRNKRPEELCRDLLNAPELIPGAVDELARAIGFVRSVAEGDNELCGHLYSDFTSYLSHVCEVIDDSHRRIGFTVGNGRSPFLMAMDILVERWAKFQFEIYGCKVEGVDNIRAFHSPASIDIGESVDLGLIITLNSGEVFRLLVDLKNSSRLTRADDANLAGYTGQYKPNTVSLGNGDGNYWGATILDASPISCLDVERPENFERPFYVYGEEEWAPSRRRVVFLVGRFANILGFDAEHGYGNLPERFLTARRCAEAMLLDIVNSGKNPGLSGNDFEYKEALLGIDRPVLLSLAELINYFENGS
jgi:hypothetical protein